MQFSIGKMIKRRQNSITMYQIAHKHCSASGAASAIRTMSQATDALNAWMSSNRLLLNPHKTQYIWLGPRQHLDKLDSVSPFLLNSIPFSCPLLSGILGSFWTKNCLSVST